MAKDHGLSGLFSDEESARPGKDTPATDAPGEDLPPVLDDADKSPLELLADRIGLDEQGDPEPAPAEASGKQDAAPEPETERPAFSDPFSAALAAGGYSDDLSPFAEQEPEIPVGFGLPRAERPAGDIDGILCFLLPGQDDRARRRTLEALNMAAGIGAVRLRSLPTDPEAMDKVLSEAIRTSDCSLVAFLSPGTEPADDWALECVRAFKELPRTGAVTVCAANADPLSPWARVAFFMEEAERQEGRSQGFDTMVFRRRVLAEIGDKLGPAIRNGQLVAAVEGRGHRISPATEARVSITTPSQRREVMSHVREQARLAGRYTALRTNVVLRPFRAVSIMLGYPFRILAVRKAAKRAVGTSQFREVASKAAMAVFADRRVRAWKMLFPGKDRR